ncbi:MAG TPA: DUF1697 domain-containing protein [Solirubrobacterales bacterium]|jgi:uncharacterized protein (DUF1697 family)|nr:DUF1697 domain-containing protein [Solirubrobacterales bacterium]
MERYVAFLRGMNLGKRRVKNPELVGHFEAMGVEEVATFRASGNVVFVDPAGEGEAELQRRLEAGLDARLGYDVAVFLRSAKEVAAIAARQPFDARAIAASKGKPQVVLLGGKPGAKARRALEEIAPAGDLMVIEGRELHWLPAVGLSETELDTKALDAALGKGTTRTAGTIEQIAARYCG